MYLAWNMDQQLSTIHKWLIFCFCELKKTPKSSHLNTFDDGKHSKRPEAAEGSEERQHQLVIWWSYVNLNWLVHHCRLGWRVAWRWSWRVAWRLGLLLQHQVLCGTCMCEGDGAGEDKGGGGEREGERNYTWTERERELLLATSQTAVPFSFSTLIFSRIFYSSSRWK